MAYLLVLILVVFGGLPMNDTLAQLAPGYYSSKNLQKLTQIDILEQFRDKQVLILGEEHDDEEGHREKANLYQSLFKELKPSLSLEMFETDQQIILDEFSSGILEGKQISRETRVWNQFERDYLPLLEIAKANKVRILGANAPRRYTRIASRGGLPALEKLNSEAKSFLPPLYMIKAFTQPEYEAKFNATMGGHSGGTNSFFLAQELWDTCMAHTIATHVANTGNQVVHVNGRFHSDEGMGVAYRLRKLGFRVLTISMFPYRKEPVESLQKVGDILYISK